MQKTILTQATTFDPSELVLTSGRQDQKTATPRQLVGQLFSDATGGSGDPHHQALQLLLWVASDKSPFCVKVDRNVRVSTAT